MIVSHSDETSSGTLDKIEVKNSITSVGIVNLQKSPKKTEVPWQNMKLLVATNVKFLTEKKMANIRCVATLISRLFN